MNPASGSALVGVTGYMFAPTEMKQDCNGVLYGPYSPTSVITWSSDNTPVVTVDGAGNETTVAPGSANILAQWQEVVGVNYSCAAIYGNVGTAARCDVLAPTLSGPSSVTRGDSATFTIQNASSQAQISGWQFTDGTNTVTRTTGTASTSWSGVMVTSGTVSVTVTAGGRPFPLSKTTTVNARSGLAFAAVSPTKVANGSDNGDGGTITTPNPPVSGGHLGEFYLRQKFSVQTTAVNDSGPNQGFKYVSSLSNSFNNVSTGYLYVVPPDAENTASTFYQSQCGNYNAQTNPSGFISGANLLAGIIRHESGPANSHYANYVAAQGDTANNLGVVGESQTGAPSVTLDTFTNGVVTTLNGKVSVIAAAAQVEPCAVNRDASCVFLGNVNFAPYQSCQ